MDSFFAVYKEKKLYYYQEIKNDFDLDELKEFIKNSLFIEQIKITYKDDIVYINQKENKHIFIKPIKSKLFKYYLIYILFICILFYFNSFHNFISSSNNNNSNPIMDLKNQTEQIRIKQKFTYLSSLILNIYKKAKEKKVFLHSLRIENAKIIVKLNAINKNNIYDFLNEFENMRIDAIYYDEEIKRFGSNASFKIYRR